MAIKPMNPLLSWLNDMIRLVSANEITIPTDYKDQVKLIKDTLSKDSSGLANSVLDFSVNTALVDYKIQTSNSNLTDRLNLWLQNINSDMRGEIPVGIKGLAKEYFRERWKGSSFLILRTFWEDKGGFIFPNIMYFVNGEDIVVDSNKESLSLGGKTYSLQISNSKTKSLPAQPNEKIFIQKPYTPWGNDYPIPFLVQRGVLENLLFVDLLVKKGEHIVSKALEYIMLLKKGSESLVNNPDFVYGEEDIKAMKESITDFANKRKTTPGISAYVTNFDTAIEHIIPEYAKALTAELYAPIERRILGGLGMIEVLQGLASSRRESILNPKPFFAEVKTGIDDFKGMLTDIINLMIEQNIDKHKKYFSDGKLLRITNTVVKEALTADQLTQLRSAYDRGVISRETYSDILGTDLTVEVARRKRELDEGIDIIMYPPVVQNQEASVTQEETERAPAPKETIPPDKTGPEAKNFNQMSKEEGNVIKDIDFEQAPYTKDKYPPQLDKLPAGARSIWINTFNAILSDTNNEDNARQGAWRNVKLKYKKVGDKWIQKTKGEFEESVKAIDLDELIKIKKLDILGKQNAILDKLIEENEDGNK